MRGEEYLTKPGQYSLVYNKGNSYVSDLVVMRTLPNGFPLSRCGFSVSKRVGKAVVRNRVKRWLREILRVTPLKPGWDIVFIARPRVTESDFAGLRGVVEVLLSRAHLLDIDGESHYLAENKAGSHRGFSSGQN